MLLKRLFSGEDLLEQLGDLEELFRLDCRDRGRRRAVLRYQRRLLRVLASRSLLAVYWRIAMLKNYLVIAWRHMKREKGYAAINITGLAIGLAAFCVTALWLQHEFSFDRFHERASRIYRVIERRHFPDHVRTSYRTPGPLSEVLRQSFPEFARTARVAWTGERVIRSGDSIHYEREILTVDPEFFDLFTFPFLKGSSIEALRAPDSMVITESTARKYFGEEDPVGRTLNLDDRFDFTVTGVVRDVPSNSHLQFDMAVPFEIVEKLGWITEAWDFSMALTYVELREGVDTGDLEERIAGIVRSHDPDSNIELFLQPLTRIRLFTNFDNPGSSGRIQYITIFSLVGILVLGMACINFVNLTTSRSESRGREIGLRKVVGARRAHIVRQFLSEAVFLAFLALAVSPLLAQLLLPLVNMVTEETFALSDLADGSLALLFVGVTFLTGILSGAYPALFLSRFQPVQTLKKRSSEMLRGAAMRKTLVVVQMSISLALIIVSVVILNQIGFLKSKDLGFNQEHVVSIPLGISNQENPELLERIKAELGATPRIQLVSGAFTHPTMFGSQAQDVVHNGRRLDEDLPVNITSVTHDFIETLQIKMLQGRSFSRDYGIERGNLIVNQSFEQILGVDSALGQTIHLGEDYQGTIVGVMQDFHMESVSGRMIGPLILFQNPDVNYIFARISPGDLAGALGSLEQAWKKAAPHLPFAYTFLDQEFDELYSDVEGLGTALKFMTLLAVFIACLGLLGLASFSTRKRTKEIGMRKVLGASMTDIVSLLSRDFVKLVLTANLLTWPVAWWLMHSWLQSFPYRVSLNIWIFILAGASVLGATLLTVSYQTLKTALADPVDSLRYE